MTPSTPSVRAIVARHAEATADNRVFFHPDIPEHRLAEALRGYPAVKTEDVLVLLDNTDSGSADEGALLTADALHVRDHGQPPRRFPLDGLGTVSLEPGPPRVLEIGGGAVLMHLRVRPETMERLVAMLREIAEGFSTAGPTGPQETPNKEKTMDQTNDLANVGQEEAAPLEGGSAPELWTPSATVCLSVVFSPAFGACLNGLNWQALGKPALAKRSFLWMIPALVLPITSVFLLPPAAVGLVTVACFLAWYFVEARKHTAYVRDNVSPEYRRRPWVVPLACALAGSALLVFGIGAMAEWSKATGGNRPSWQTRTVEEDLEEQAVELVTKIVASSGDYPYHKLPKCIRVKITDEVVENFYRATATLDTGRDLPVTIELKDDTIHVRAEF